MRTLYLLLFQLLVACNIAMAADTPDYTSRVVDSFMDYYKYGIDEKLYLQTDKPYYSAGENIWFKGYLVNAITHHPFDLSNFIYVELTDRKGELVSRVKVKRDSLSGFNGYIKLDPKMEVGDHSLRAYTKWMTNSAPEFFFEKSIEIISPIPENSMAGQVQSEAAEAAVTAKDKREEKREEKRSGENLKYDLQFFPEGGALIAGVLQNVAFKAVAEDGISIEIMGEIYNSKHQEVATFRTEHNGMGMLQLNVPEGDQYYAKAKSSEGEELQVKLPLSSSKEVSLKVSRVGSNIYYQAIASKPELLEGVSAVIHSRGRIITVDGGDLRTPRKMSLSQFYPGVSVISLINQSADVVAERIFFKKPVNSPSVEITPSKENYKSRTKASVNLKVIGSNGQPAQGQFAVSVIDDGAIVRDSTQDNVLSYLLLSSEIKGYVEKPGLYFLDDSRLTDNKLDLLMMTQGWRRFDLEKVLDKDANHRRTYQYEDVVSITGEVKGFFGNKAKKPKLSMICQKLHLIDVFELDQSNKFSIIDVNLPDSVVYVLQTQGRFGGNALTLNIPEEVLPDARAAQYPREKEVVPFQFINQSMEKFYFEGGLTLIELESVEVTTEKVNKVANSEFALRSTEREELESMGGVTIADLLVTYIGITVDGEEVSYRGNSTPVKFWVNGLEEEYVNLMYLTVDLIEQVDFFDASAATGLFSDASGGVFNITLRDGASIPRLRLPNIVNYSPLGYQRVEKFYAPAYDTPSKKSNLPPDHRTTIFWSGDIYPNEAGDVTFDFYTADRSTTYRVIVEGVTSQGELCHSEAVVKRNE